MNPPKRNVAGEYWRPNKPRSSQPTIEPEETKVDLKKVTADNIDEVWRNLRKKMGSPYNWQLSTKAMLRSDSFSRAKVVLQETVQGINTPPKAKKVVEDNTEVDDAKKYFHKKGSNITEKIKTAEVEGEKKKPIPKKPKIGPRAPNIKNNKRRDFEDHRMWPK